jgi:hypothetical protein
MFAIHQNGSFRSQLAAHTFAYVVVQEDHVKTTCIAVLSDPEVRANREASEIIPALRRDALADNFAWQKLCHAGKYLDARLDQILREPSMPDEPLAHSGKGAA